MTGSGGGVAPATMAPPWWWLETLDAPKSCALFPGGTGVASRLLRVGPAAQGAETFACLGGGPAAEGGGERPIYFEVWVVGNTDSAGQGAALFLRSLSGQQTLLNAQPLEDDAKLRPGDVVTVGGTAAAAAPPMRFRLVVAGRGADELEAPRLRNDEEPTASAAAAFGADAGGGGVLPAVAVAAAAAEEEEPLDLALALPDPRTPADTEDALREARCVLQAAIHAAETPTVCLEGTPAALGATRFDFAAAAAGEPLVALKSHCGLQAAPAELGADRKWRSEDEAETAAVMLGQVGASALGSPHPPRSLGDLDEDPPASDGDDDFAGDDLALDVSALLPLSSSPPPAAAGAEAAEEAAEEAAAAGGAAADDRDAAAVAAGPGRGLAAEGGAGGSSGAAIAASAEEAAEAEAAASAVPVMRIAAEGLPPPFSLVCISAQGLPASELLRLPYACRALEASCLRAELRVGRASQAEAFWEALLPQPAARQQILQEHFEINLEENGMVLTGAPGAVTTVNGRCVSGQTCVKPGDVISLVSTSAPSGGTPAAAVQPPLLCFRLTAFGDEDLEVEEEGESASSAVLAHPSQRCEMMKRDDLVVRATAVAAIDPSPLSKLLFKVLC